MQEELRLRRLAAALASDDHRREVEERANQLRQVQNVSLFSKSRALPLGLLRLLLLWLKLIIARSSHF